VRVSYVDRLLEQNINYRDRLGSVLDTRYSAEKGKKRMNDKNDAFSRFVGEAA
jgi:hypothetical protein